MGPAARDPGPLQACREGQQQSRDAAEDVAHPEGWPGQLAVTAVAESLGLNRQGQIRVPSPNQVAGLLGVDACVKVIGRAGAMDGGDQLQLEQLNQCRWGGELSLGKWDGHISSWP